jgi:phosphatidylglycerol:prolipoprotein diacylglycerol transferase
VLAVLVSASIASAASASGAGLPYYDIPVLKVGPLPIQVFGLIVAVGVLIGASVMRRYSDRHGGDDDDLRGLTGWVTVCGFIGAHVFDVLAYQPELLKSDPIILLKLWEGISSYGGFLGGAMGFAFYVWWKRLSPGMWADATAIGLLVAFSIGRIGCTIVHDHIGAPGGGAFGFDYPWKALEARHLDAEFLRLGHKPGEVVHAWNLGLMELLYLIPVNITVLWLAFKGKPRSAGFLAVLVGLLYAPVRFFLEFLRLNDSDPRYLGMTFAQWCSITAFAVCGYAAMQLIKRGKPAPLKAELGGRPGGRKATAATIAAQSGRKPAAGKDGKDKAEDKKPAETAEDKAETKAEKSEKPAAAKQGKKK